MYIQFYTPIEQSDWWECYNHDTSKDKVFLEVFSKRCTINCCHWFVCHCQAPLKLGHCVLDTMLWGSLPLWVNSHAQCGNSHAKGYTPMLLIKPGIPGCMVVSWCGIVLIWLSCLFHTDCLCRSLTTDTDTHMHTHMHMHTHTVEFSSLIQLE